MRIAAILLLAASISACNGKGIGTSTIGGVVPQLPHPTATIRTTRQSLEAALGQRMEAKGWSKGPAPQPWQFAYRHPMNGILPSLMYLENAQDATARYDFLLTESTAAVTIEGRFVIQKDPASEGEERGGEPVSRLDAMFADLKKSLEIPRN